MEKEAKTEDFEILVDLLISLLNISNKDLRSLLESIFREYLPHFDKEILNMVVKEILTPLWKSNEILINPEESEDDLDDSLEEEKIN